MKIKNLFEEILNESRIEQESRRINKAFGMDLAKLLKNTIPEQNSKHLSKAVDLFINEYKNNTNIIGPFLQFVKMYRIYSELYAGLDWPYKNYQDFEREFEKIDYNYFINDVLPTIYNNTKNKQKDLKLLRKFLIDNPGIELEYVNDIFSRYYDTDLPHDNLKNITFPEFEKLVNYNFNAKIENSDENFNTSSFGEPHYEDENFKIFKGKGPELTKKLCGRGNPYHLCIASSSYKYHYYDYKLTYGMTDYFVYFKNNEIKNRFENVPFIIVETLLYDKKYKLNNIKSNADDEISEYYLKKYLPELKDKITNIFKFELPSDDELKLMLDENFINDIIRDNDTIITMKENYIRYIFETTKIDLNNIPKFINELLITPPMPDKEDLIFLIIDYQLNSLNDFLNLPIEYQKKLITYDCFVSRFLSKFHNIPAEILNSLPNNVAYSDYIYNRRNKIHIKNLPFIYLNKVNDYGDGGIIIKDLINQTDNFEELMPELLKYNISSKAFEFIYIYAKFSHNIPIPEELWKKLFQNKEKSLSLSALFTNITQKDPTLNHIPPFVFDLLNTNQLEYLYKISPYYNSPNTWNLINKNLKKNLLYKNPKYAWIYFKYLKFNNIPKKLWDHFTQSELYTEYYKDAIPDHITFSDDETLEEKVKKIFNS
jgi:hypothetical protein